MNSDNRKVLGQMLVMVGAMLFLAVGALWYAYAREQVTGEVGLGSYPTQVTDVAKQYVQASVDGNASRMYGLLAPVQQAVLTKDNFTVDYTNKRAQAVRTSVVAIGKPRWVGNDLYAVQYDVAVDVKSGRRAGTRGTTVGVLYVESVDGDLHIIDPKYAGARDTLLSRDLADDVYSLMCNALAKTSMSSRISPLGLVAIKGVTGTKSMEFAAWAKAELARLGEIGEVVLPSLPEITAMDDKEIRVRAGYEVVKADGNVDVFAYSLLIEPQSSASSNGSCFRLAAIEPAGVAPLDDVIIGRRLKEAYDELSAALIDATRAQTNAWVESPDGALPGGSVVKSPVKNAKPVGCAVGRILKFKGWYGPKGRATAEIQASIDYSSGKSVWTVDSVVTLKQNESGDWCVKSIKPKA